MNWIIQATPRRALAAGSVLVLCLSLGACSDEQFADHFAHRDLVTSSAGNANATNSATQTITPWPKEARNSTINVDGKRLAIGVQRYQANKSIPPKGISTSNAAPAATPQSDPGAPSGPEVQK